MTLNESVGRFNVRKTLRFEMKPLGKTAENLDAFLAEDEDRASDLHTIKPLVEAEHLALVRRVFNALPDPLPGYSEIKHSFKRDPAYPVLSGRGTATTSARTFLPAKIRFFGLRSCGRTEFRLAQAGTTPVGCR